MQNFDGCKIWIGDDRELSAKIQDAAFKAGWTWGRSFGGTVLKPGKIRFIKFESYGGEKRMFSGHSGKSNREGFDSCPDREIYASAMGIIHHSGQCNLEDPDWLPSRGDKVKLLRYESIDEYETTKMKEKLAIGEVYEVLESDVNFRSADGRKCIRLVEVNQWYFLSAFTKWVAGDSTLCSLEDFTPSVSERLISIYVDITRGTKIKVGDTLRITDRPLTWNSLFSNKSPMDKHINYPMEVVVEKYTDDYGGTFLAGGFGWCLEGLIKKGCARLVKNSGSGMLPSEAYLASLAHQSPAGQSLSRAIRQDPTNIKVQGVTKAAPVASRVKVFPIEMINVPIILPIRAKQIDRVTTKSNLIQI